MGSRSSIRPVTSDAHEARVSIVSYPPTSKPTGLVGSFTQPSTLHPSLSDAVAVLIGGQRFCVDLKRDPFPVFIFLDGPPLQSRIDWFALKREHCEDTFVNPPERLATNESFKRLYAKSEFPERE